MKLFWFFILPLFLCALFIDVRCESFPTDGNGILLLNNDTYQEVVNEFKNLFPLLYIKHATESETAVVNIDNLVNELKKRNIEATVAKVSLEYDNDIFTKYNLDGPVAFMAMMDHGDRFVEFTDNLNNLDSLVLFVKRKLEEPVKLIDDPDLLRAVIENSPCISVGFFENFTTPEYEDYKSNADWYFHCDHFASMNPLLFRYFKVEERIPTIKMYKGCVHDSFDFPSQLPVQGMFILKFFLVAMEPDVSKFGMNWLMKRTFQEPQFALLLFVKKDDEKKQFYIDIMEKYARRYREEINMAYVEVDGEEDASSLLYTFDIKDTDAPIIRAIELSNRYGNNTRKYMPKRKTINDDTIKRFIGDVYYRQLQPYLISEKIPKDWNKEPILTLVGEHFKNVTEDPTKTVLVVFYNDEKKYDAIVKGQLKQLAIELQKEGRTDIVIGKSNYVYNEYFGWHPTKFPAIVLFPKGINKFGIVYVMDLFYENLKIFIESDGKINKKEDNEDSSKGSDQKRNRNENVHDDDDGDGVVTIESEINPNQSSQKTEL